MVQVNEINLFHAEYEPLKHKIFGAAILVDDEAAAFALLNRNRPCDVYTRSGYRLSKYGLVEHMPENQKNECRLISGAQEYKIVQQGTSIMRCCSFNIFSRFEYRSESTYKNKIA